MIAPHALWADSVIRAVPRVLAGVLLVGAALVGWLR